MVVGHSTIGRKQYFMPMVGADFEPVAKRSMEFVWHLSTVALALPPVALAYAGANPAAATELRSLLLFIVVFYGILGAVHLINAVTSEIERAPFKLFQWILFFAVAGTAWLGT